MAKIQMDYQEMQAVAGDISKQADLANQVISTLDSSVKELLASWAGSSKEAFEMLYQLFHKELELVPALLTQSSQALLQTAATIAQAEQEAAATITATVTGNDAA
ncbi:MAG: WXG100 family type VII secretion target [Chloroflexota bacterium]